MPDASRSGTSMIEAVNRIVQWRFQPESNTSLSSILVANALGTHDELVADAGTSRTSADVRIAYISLGDGFPLVFASNIFGEANGYRIGWPQTREITDRLVGLGWRVVRYDVRGMGLSERDVLDLSLEGRVRDLTAVVGHLGLDRFALGGLDVGA